MKWKTVEFKKNQIRAETDRAILLNCPHNSYYDGYCFWLPLSFVREGYCKVSTFAYPDDFEFTLRKYGKGRYNSRDVIDEVVLKGDEIEQVYEHSSIKKQVDYNPFETHIPEKLEAEPTEAIGELIDE